MRLREAYASWIVHVWEEFYGHDSRRRRISVIDRISRRAYDLAEALYSRFVFTVTCEHHLVLTPRTVGSPRLPHLFVMPDDVLFNTAGKHSAQLQALCSHTSFYLSRSYLNFLPPPPLRPTSCKSTLSADLCICIWLLTSSFIYSPVQNHASMLCRSFRVREVGRFCYDMSF